MNKYEVIITGSSRPSLYPKMWESFNRMIKMKDKPKITAYEDVILPEESRKSKGFIKPKVDEYIEFNPNIRLGKVFDEALQDIKCEYFIYLQEDWEFIKEIDIDRLVEIMDKNINIQQIWFPKRLADPKTYDTMCGNDIEIDGVDLMPYTSWSFIPHIVRSSFIKYYYDKGSLFTSPRPEAPFKRLLKKEYIIPDYSIIEDGNINMEQTVSFALGKRHEIYIKHLGGKLTSVRMIKERG